MRRAPAALPVGGRASSVPLAMPSMIVRFEGRALGSPLRLQVHGGPPAAADRAWMLIGEEFAAVDRALSRHRDDSELTALNRLAGRGAIRPLGRRLYVAIAASDRARRSTDGRFDARILADLERLGDHGADLGELDDRPIKDRARSGLRARRGQRSRMRRDPRRRRVALDRPHDLGGIGKGLALRWAADRAAGVLESSRGYLLEAGGDIVARGSPLDQSRWSIAIEDPGLNGPPLAVVATAAGAVCTSSIARRRWHLEDGEAVHHLIDPATGDPGGAGLLAVTVAGTDPAWAEVWSKALFLEGWQGIGDLARGRDLAAWWVEKGGELRMTPAARVMTDWTREPATTS